MLLYFAVYFSFIYFVSASRSFSNGGKTRSIPAVDALISRLEGDRWSPDDGDCLQATLDMLKGVKNNTLWAVWAWESMQPPVGSMYGAEMYLGNYDQCLKAPWIENHPGLRSQYCLVEVTSPGEDQVKDVGPFEDAEEYYKRPTKDGRRFNKHYIGVCLPSICPPSSVTKLAQHLLDITHLPGKVHVSPQNCEKAGEEIVYSTGYYIFWSLFGLLIATTVYSTYFHKSNADGKILGTIANSFSMKRNYNSLFKVSLDEVKVMHGMRFLTAAFIVLAHEYFYHILCPIVNGLDLNKTLHTTFGLLVAHLDVIVDTFFAMSGLLIVRGLLLGKQKNIFYTLVKRYLRLVGPYAFCILYLITTAMYMNRGPFWKLANAEEEEVCKQYWWKSLLMINTDIDSLCHIVTWYISCDYQLAALATFLFYIYSKNKKLATIIFTVIAVVTTVHLGLNVYWKQLDILPFTYKTITLKRSYTDLHYTYSKSHVRVGAYMVGMVMGYIMTLYKPAQYRNFIGKKQSIIIGSISVLTLCIIASMAVVFENRPYDAVEAAIVVSTNRIFWAVAICCLIGVSEYGELREYHTHIMKAKEMKRAGLFSAFTFVALIPDLLSWPGFVPLSKLSYCLYLVHPIVIQLYKFNGRGGAPYHVYSIVVFSCGALLVSCFGSFVLHLTVEAPVINLSNELFSEKKAPVHQNGAKVDLNQNEAVTSNENVKTKLS